MYEILTDADQYFCNLHKTWQPLNLILRTAVRVNHEFYTFGFYNVSYFAWLLKYSR
jgi:hypothetical protein